MTLTELKLTLSERDLMDFLNEFGGQRIYVPQKVTEGHYIAQKIGHVNLEKLAYKWGGEIVDVPTTSGFKSKDRQTKVVELKAAGKSNNEIARLTGLSRRAVQKIAAKAKASQKGFKQNSLQGELF